MPTGDPWLFINTSVTYRSNAGIFTEQLLNTLSNIRGPELGLSYQNDPNNQLFYNNDQLFQINDSDLHNVQQTIFESDLGLITISSFVLGVDLADDKEEEKFEKVNWLKNGF